MLSALIHLLCGWLLVFKHHPEVTPQSVTIVYQPRSRIGSVGPHARRTKAATIPLSALVPKMPINPTTAKTLEGDLADIARGPGLSPTAGQSKEQIRFVGSLWRMIDQFIEENPFLSEYNHTGEVYLRFDVDLTDRLVPGSLYAEAADRVLKVIAARAIRRAILNETGDVQFPHEHVRIHARFHWASYELCQDRRGFHGNTLSFCHYAENKRRTFSSGERAATWAGAIYNHGPWAYEDIQKYNREERRRKAEFNPFRQYELDPDWNL